jgi:holliday junction DNA helicase RuvA
MIDIVTGEVASFDKTSIVVMVGGVGLRVSVPRTVFESVHGAGDPIQLFTHLVVREDALALFGFLTQEDRTIFETLISLSGVGPKTALAVLSTISLDHLRVAVQREEPEILTRVPGIGKKTAEKIIFELKGKLAIGVVPGVGVISDADTDVIAALTAMGFSIVEAQSAVQSIPRNAPKNIEERIRIALQYFG